MRRPRREESGRRGARAHRRLLSATTARRGESARSAHPDRPPAVRSEPPRAQRRRITNVRDRDAGSLPREPVFTEHLVDAFKHGAANSSDLAGVGTRDRLQRRENSGSGSTPNATNAPSRAQTVRRMVSESRPGSSAARRSSSSAKASVILRPYRCSAPSIASVVEPQPSASR
jgi:hypothetical protein